MAKCSEMHPEELFELFFKNIKSDMNRPGFRHHHPEVGCMWWRERFMNAFHGVEELRGLRSWAEAPQMWLAGYRAKEKGP